MEPFHHWLIKTEPGAYSLEDLKRDGRTHWDGVRNYQARNLMRDGMRVGDPIIFYYSNAEPPGAVGVAKVASAAYPDYTAQDPANEHYDPKATPENPIWSMVDVEYVATFSRKVGLDEMRRDPRLAGLVLIRPGTRLSVQPVSPEHFAYICKLGGLS